MKDVSAAGMFSSDLTWLCFCLPTLSETLRYERLQASVANYAAANSSIASMAAEFPQICGGELIRSEMIAVLLFFQPSSLARPANPVSSLHLLVICRIPP